MFIIFLCIRTTGLLFHLLLIYSIAFCCVAEFLAPLLIDSLISLKCVFGVSRNVNLSIHYSFSLKCSLLFCPWRLCLGFPKGWLVLFPLFFACRTSYIFSFIYLKYSSTETELLNCFPTMWPSRYLQGWRWGPTETQLKTSHPCDVSMHLFLRLG